jgi:hypothetical protein
MMDTGAIDTWITASTCTTNECKLHNSFNPEDSSSFVWQDQSLDEISFGPWGTMAVNLGQDNWKLNSTSFQEKVNIHFWLGQKYSGPRFAELIQDGFLACGPNGRASRSNLLFDFLWYRGFIANPFMSYWVDYTINGEKTDTGAFVFGGEGSGKYDPDSLITLEVIDDIFWTHVASSVEIGDAIITEKPEFILDTGASEIKGEKEDIDRLINAVTRNGELPLSPQNPDNYNYPDLVINIGKKMDGTTGRLTFKPRNYFNFIEAGEDKGKWAIAFTVLPGLGKNKYTFGTNLLDTLYSEWEYDASGPFLVAKEVRLASRI